ncbi:hypothetical protein K3495_g10432 [Podosphaera aphanis]|nr:hypothetical protein K3495_g10432 [Podosphaera aphanis]
MSCSRCCSNSRNNEFNKDGRPLTASSIQETYQAWRNRDKQIKVDGTGELSVDGYIKANALDIEEAEENKKKDASLATQLALAYAIHKSFIFIRVPITAAITPRIVKMLRNWGWDIGRRTTKEAKELRRAALNIKNCQTKSKDKLRERIVNFRTKKDK